MEYLIFRFPHQTDKMAQCEQIDEESMFYEVHEVVVKKLGHVPIAKGDFHLLPKNVQGFIAKWVSFFSETW